jgi:hypothetical protein
MSMRLVNNLIEHLFQLWSNTVIIMLIKIVGPINFLVSMIHLDKHLSLNAHVNYFCNKLSR